MELPVPVYLNQRIVFDLVAMLQDGIATITKVSEASHEKSSASGEIDAKFGLNKAFSSLFKIDLSGKLKKKGEEGDQISISEERTHTPASLFNTLRDIVFEKKLITNVTAESKLKAGQLIEFKTSLKKNPLIDTMDALIELMNLKIIFEDKPKKGSGNKTNENKKILNKMNVFHESLKTGETIDITTSELESGHKAVITLEKTFLNDPTMSDIVDGTFFVFGKITRVIKDSSESISLMRKTVLAKMPKNILAKVFTDFSSLSKEKNFAIPEIVLEIPGPVIQIIPISIYA